MAFKLLLAERGVRRGKGKTNQHTAKATIAQAAAELGVPERTAKHRLKLADEFEALPAKAQVAVWATRRLGEIIQEGQQRGEIASKGKPQKISHDAILTLSDIGLTPSQSSRAQQLASIPQKQVERAAAKERQKQSEGRGKKVRKVSLPIQSRDAIGKAIGMSESKLDIGRPFGAKCGRLATTVSTVGCSC
jgi:hypothetical protein